QVYPIQLVSWQRGIFRWRVVYCCQYNRVPRSTRSVRMDIPPMDAGSAAPAPAAAAPSTFDGQRPWLTHYSPGVPTAIALPKRPLTWLLDEAVRKHGTNTAIVYYGAKISYVQLSALVDRFAHALLGLGLRRGDRVALCLPNMPQYPIAFYGVLKAGGVAVPTNPLYTA